MNATTSGFVGGAASGAAMGASVGGPWGAAIGGVVGGVAGLFTGASSDASEANQEKWAEYAAYNQLDNSTQNIQANTAIAGLNAQMEVAGAQASGTAIRSVSQHNAGLVRAAAEYNGVLLDQEVEYLWEELGLNLELLDMQRARERGDIIAQQSASGTVIGEGSNARVIEDQMTSQAFDEFVLRYGADVQAGKIENAKAQNTWMAETEARKIEWEGNLSATIRESNSILRAGAIVAQSGITGGVTSNAAISQYTMNAAGISQQQDAYNFQNQQNMVRGLFSAGSTAARGYANNYTPTAGEAGTSLFSTPSASSQSNTYEFDTGYQFNY